MDSKVSAATWALDRGVNVVICNGTQEKAIKTIIGGRKVGTFFTENAVGGPTPVDTLAENGKWFLADEICRDEYKCFPITYSIVYDEYLRIELLKWFLFHYWNAYTHITKIKI